MEYYDKIKTDRFDLNQVLRQMIVRPMSNRIPILIKTYRVNEIVNRDKKYFDAEDFILIDPIERHKKFGCFQMPEVNVDVRGEIKFRDGRHRFTVFKDLGARLIPVAMDKESIKNAKRFDII